MPKKSGMLPRKEEMASEWNDPRRVSQTKMYKGPRRMLSLMKSFHAAVRAEVRAPGAGVLRRTQGREISIKVYSSSEREELRVGVGWMEEGRAL